jgi:hypothetical protein
MNCAWIFQADPKKYNIAAMLNDEEVANEFHWQINQHKNDIHTSHKGLIWVSGESAGVYALVEVISEPGIWEESEAEKSYWIDSSNEEGSQLRVKLRIIKNLTNNPISKRSLKMIDGLQDLRIIKQPWGKNPFKVFPEQWDLLIKKVIC